MNKQILVKSYFVVIIMAGLVHLTGCQTTTGNLNLDMNSYSVPLYANEYTPKIDAAKYPQLTAQKMCLSNIRNDARDTTIHNYYSKDRRVEYTLSNKANTLIQFVQSYFWYAYQKAFIQAGLDTSANCSAENIPELWIIFQSFNDDELQLKITVLKNRVTLYEKDIVVTMPPATERNVLYLQKRAYEMIDMTVMKILDDPGFQNIIIK
jgi:hypothetical protein